MATTSQNKLYYNSILTLHLFLIVTLGLSLCISVMILTYTVMHNTNFSEQNMQRLAFNSWQFPMLLALFTESIVFYNFKN